MGRGPVRRRPAGIQKADIRNALRRSERGVRAVRLVLRRLARAGGGVGRGFVTVAHALVRAASSPYSTFLCFGAAGVEMSLDAARRSECATSVREACELL